MCEIGSPQRKINIAPLENTPPMRDPNEDTDKEKEPTKVPDKDRELIPQ
jgi:hypothetical protein